MLHESVAPHAAAYIQDASSGDLHELVFIPAQQAYRGRYRLDVGRELTGVAAASAGPAARALPRLPRAREGAVVVARRTPCGATRAGPRCRCATCCLAATLRGEGSDRSPADDRVADGKTIARRVVGRPNHHRNSPGGRGVVLFVVFGFLTPTLGETGVTLSALRADQRARRNLPVLRDEGRATHRDVEPRLEADGRVQLDSLGA